jgi:hypothetical protein
VTGRLTRLAIAAVAAVGLATAACGSISTYRWPLAQPAPPTQRPEVYFEGQMPSTSMSELELVEAIGYGTRANMGDIVNALQDEAQRYGASAVVRVRVDCGHGTCHGYGVAVRYLQR